jgi:hypothetical protein
MLNAAWMRDIPLPAILPGTAVTLAIGAASIQSAAINSTVVRLVATADCHIVFGANPTATVNDTLLPANQPEYFVFTPCQLIAAIQDSVPGNLFITPAI